MAAREDEALVRRRLEELAMRCGQQGRSCFTGFLSPAEGEWAVQAGRRAQVVVALEGGYEDAERRIARFSPGEGWEEAFPIAALGLKWPKQSAPAHRDILGSVMGLGVQRHCVGDIVLEAEQAVVFVEASMASHLQAGLISAGRVKLQTEVLDALPSLSPMEGREMRDTVASLRLDAVVAAGFGLSRAKAAALIAAGQVKLRHLPNQHVDAQVNQDDTLSVRGFGRVRITEIGQPTRKGRFPLQMLRYGEKHS